MHQNIVLSGSRILNLSSACAAISCVFKICLLSVFTFEFIKYDKLQHFSYFMNSKLDTRYSFSWHFVTYLLNHYNITTHLLPFSTQISSSSLLELESLLELLAFFFLAFFRAFFTFLSFFFNFFNFCLVSFSLSLDFLLFFLSLLLLELSGSGSSSELQFKNHYLVNLFMKKRVGVKPECSVKKVNLNTPWNKLLIAYYKNVTLLFVCHPTECHR